MTDTEQIARRLCTFRVDKFFIGIELTEVQEVIRQQDLRPVPLACAAIRGLMNLRGQIVTVIDLRESLRLSPRADDRAPMNVVVRADGDIVSFLVDEVGEVLEIPESDFEPLPETADVAVRQLIQGAYKRPDRLLLQLNIKRTLNLIDGTVRP